MNKIIAVEGVGYRVPARGSKLVYLPKITSGTIGVVPPYGQGRVLVKNPGSNITNFPKEKPKLHQVVTSKAVGKNLKANPEFVETLDKNITDGVKGGQQGKYFGVIDGNPSLQKRFFEVVHQAYGGLLPYTNPPESAVGTVETTINSQFGVNRIKLPKVPGAGRLGRAFGSSIPRFIETYKAKNFINLPIIGGPPDDAPASDEDMYETFLQCMKEEDYDMSYDDIRDAKPAIGETIARGIQWYQVDDQTFWKIYPAQLSDVASLTSSEDRIMAELGVLAEHWSFCEPIEEFNPQDKPWIWQLPDDKDNLVATLSKLYSEKEGGKPMYEYLAGYKYMGKWVLPRYVALDVAMDALYELLDRPRS